MSAPAYPPTIKTQPLARDGSLSFWWYPATQAPDTFGYTIYDQNSTVLANVSSNVQTATVTSLTNGQTYSCWLSAGNIAGESPPAYFRPFEPGFPPTLSTLSNVATKIGSNSASITWEPSGETPVAPIRWYVVKAVSSDPAASTFRYTTNGLTNETSLFATGFNQYSYQFSIQSVNCPGYSPVALTNSINFAPAGAGGSWAFNKSFVQQFLYTNQSPFGWLPGTGSYTWECFVYFTALGADDLIEMSFGDFPTVNSPGIKIIQFTGKGAPTKEFILGDGAGTGSGITLPYANLLTSNTWYHFAISRNSGTSDTALWINGTRESLSNDTTDYNLRYNNDLYLFIQAVTASGYITNLNFIQGAYKYDPANATITVPTTPITSNANTVALWLATDAGNIFTDSGPNAYTTSNDSGITWASNSPF
jgi:hypothetical protein